MADSESGEKEDTPQTRSKRQPLAGARKQTLDIFQYNPKGKSLGRPTVQHKSVDEYTCPQLFENEFFTMNFDFGRTGELKQ